MVAHGSFADAFLRSEHSEAADPPSPKRPRHEVRNNTGIENGHVIADPALRPIFSDYHPITRDRLRREYLLRGPTQTIMKRYPMTDFGKQKRSFNPKHFENEAYKDWLEYSEDNDALFCLACYLFPTLSNNRKTNLGNAFSLGGFRNWKKLDEGLQKHLGSGTRSYHSLALDKCKALMTARNDIQAIVQTVNASQAVENTTRLMASVDVAMFLAKQGLPFRGHDERDASVNRGNFLELLDFVAAYNDSVRRVVLNNAPQNLRLSSPEVQKEIVHSAAQLCREAIVREIQASKRFCVLVDEARDVSVKEQMAIVVRYVNSSGCIKERLLDLVHVSDTESQTLFETLDATLKLYHLRLDDIRGQGYDGASNMCGANRGLKTLILERNASAFFVHCWAHRLQLCLVSVARRMRDVNKFFFTINSIYNITCSSCRRRDVLREEQLKSIRSACEDGVVETGRGQNQETSLRPAGETRWGSHHHSLARILLMFDSLVNVLQYVADEGSLQQQRAEAEFALETVESFDFVFTLILMKKILSLSVDFSNALQRKDQDIVNALSLLETTKNLLVEMRDSGWSSLIEEVCLFCSSREIPVVNMEDVYQVRGRRRNNADSERNTNDHHYRVQVFLNIIDEQLAELEHRFPSETIQLLHLASSLDPKGKFQKFCVVKLVALSKMYPEDFDALEIMCLEAQLMHFVRDARSTEEFQQCKSLLDVSQVIVRLNKHPDYPLVYRLISLVLLLPVSTATAERAFSGLKIVKSRLRNRLADEFLSDLLVLYLNKDLQGPEAISKKKVAQRYLASAPRRGLYALDD